MRLKSFDNYLIAAMGILALLSLYMLYGVKLTSFGPDNELRVASIVEQIKTVKRKRDFYQSWMDVNPGDSLTDDDEIYTHGQSSAKIHFINGPSISLFENSLLRIKALNKESTISLEKGNFTAQLTKDSPKLDVLLNGKKYSFESQNANVQIEQGDLENKFLLLDGQVKLNIDQTVQEMRVNQVLIQNKKSGDLKIEALPFVQKTPEANFTRYFAQDVSITFSWAYTSLKTPTTIVIAKESTFKDVLLEENVTDNSFSHLFNQPGIYFWKLVSPEGISGPIRSFTLLEEQPLSLILEKEIVYKGPKKIETVKVNWSKNNGKTFLLKLESPDGLVKEFELQKNHYELSAEILGTYKIAVKVSDTNRPVALWSEPGILQVLEAKSIPITSNTPELFEKINYSEEATHYLLSWNGPREGVNYTIKLTRESQKEAKTEIYQTENLNLPLTLNESGSYRWELTGTTESGILTNTLGGKIILKSALKMSQSPKEGSVIELERPDQLVAFNWSKVQNAKDYQFELSDDADFKNLIANKDVESNTISTAIAKTGKYFWRVKVKKGEAIEYSSPTSVEIKPTPPLSTPENLPSLKLKLKYLEEKKSSHIEKHRDQQRFHWLDLFFSPAMAQNPQAPKALAEWDLPANSRAKSYIVEIYKDADLKTLVTRIESTTAHIVWENAGTGTFYWRVSYVDFWGRKTDFSKASTLSTEPDEAALKLSALKLKAELPIELESPTHRQELLEVEGDHFIFSWNELPETNSYKVLFSRDLDFENPLFELKTEMNQIKIDCSHFKNTAGDYYWKVVTNLGNTSKRRMVHVECAKKKIEQTLTQTPKITPDPLPASPTHYAQLGLLPHQLNVTNTSREYTAKVSGIVLNSFYGLYHRPLTWDYFESASSSLWLSRGKVFNTITFLDFEANVKLGTKFKSLPTRFSWGPVVALNKKTLYVEANRSMTSEGMTSILAGLYAQKRFGPLSFSGEVKFGGLLDYQVGLEYSFSHHINAGVFLGGSSLSKNSADHSFSRMGLNLSTNFSFLETTK